MKNPTMLYKCPGPHEIHGGRFDYTIVEGDEIESAMAQGWHLTTTDAKAESGAAPADDAPPTRDEMKQKAAELGLAIAHNISNAKLAELIDAALAPKD